jgi:hypothetical protein
MPYQFNVFTGTMDLVPAEQVVAYQHIQGAPASVWVIDHDLGFHPNVTVEDSAGTTVEGDPTYPSDTRVVLTFATPFSGRAFLS